eukprot:CAMPEP_0185588850 /NCGR_PEP_ID=MMETSP0434-20130131/54742_1 /TAXON_ID=626734 ORGANISM="Favella taraikaensis, Strain Fe Narragansett Bay" /NCGR_SAMPLE_ID=MMETSP0434 /ASSEMBLY_ACC=CAM_ASM_000379 /LENGTH=59 /DNA_ID=CAMNT_0028211795 /DNA_START=636 /DNA_END=815 /DNA_ORIENTATION=-
MITNDCNDERNQIMRRFKFQQQKKHKLHEFLRLERDRIVKERPEPAPKTKQQLDEKSRD